MENARTHIKNAKDYYFEIIYNENKSKEIPRTTFVGIINEDIAAASL